MNRPFEPAAVEAPLYRQVVDTLRAEIEEGRFPVGGLLPTENELRVRFGVSRHTIREALRQLRDEGLVASRQGAGTTVLKPRGADHFVHEVSSINDLITHAEELRYEVDSTGMIVADEALAERLECPPGERWLRIEGYRFKPDAPAGVAPVAWMEVFVHADYAGVALHLGRRPGPIYIWIEEMYGQHVAEVEQVLTAQPMPDQVAATLGVEHGTLGIEIRRTYHLDSGAVAAVAVNLVPASRFTHSMTLRRARP